MLQRGLLYFNTIRHLQAQQITNRLRRRLWRPRVALKPAPSVHAPIRLSGPLNRDSMIGPGTFTFLAQTHSVNAPLDWNADGRDPLWTFNLHYFDDLNSAGTEARLEQHRHWIDRWIADNPAGEGYGWEAYTISLRLVNWIKWDWRTGALTAGARDSLAHQVRHLHASLEYHLGGNHLWANAKALIFCGLYFKGEEASEWLATGRALLRREITRQVLADGGHYERSPMYHAILTQDLLELTEAARARGWISLHADREFFAEKAASMLRWLRCMCHGDGEIAFFNDAAIGIASPPEKILAYAHHLQIHAAAPADGLTFLRDSGYVRYARDGVLLLCDAGPIGPDELPGHAHADSLSFELSIDQKRLLVNSGTSTYWDQELRDLQRGTASHNTVCINGENSSEVWSRFRVARRARTTVHECRETDAGLILIASHDGYRRLRGRPVHRRTWTLNSNQLNVVDQIFGIYKNAEARFHAYPSAAKPSISAAGIEWHASEFFPGFGERVANQVACVPVIGGTARAVVMLRTPESF